MLVSGGKLMLIDGYRDAPWGWLIYDVCVASVEGAVHHCSARRFRELFHAAGFVEHRQERRPGFAPFLFNEAMHASDRANSARCRRGRSRSKNPCHGRIR